MISITPIPPFVAASAASGRAPAPAPTHPTPDSILAIQIAGIGTAAALALVPRLCTLSGATAAQSMEEACQSRSAILHALRDRAAALRPPAARRARHAFDHSLDGVYAPLPRKDPAS